MRKGHLAVVRAELAALAAVLCLAGGCNGKPEEQVLGLKAQLGEVQRKYESLVTQNEEIYQRLASLEAENETLRQDRVALVRQLEGLDEVEELKSELVRQKERTEQLERDLAQVRQDEGAPPATEQPPPNEDLALSVERGRQRLEELGAVLFERSQYGTAHAVILSALQLGSESPETFYRLGFCEAAAGNYDAAVEWYGRAIASIEEQPETDADLLKKCLNNYGIASLKLGQPEKAAELYRQAIALDDAYAPSHFNLGLVYANELNRPEDAIEAFRKHIIHGGQRSVSARDLIRTLQGHASED